MPLISITLLRMELITAAGGGEEAVDIGGRRGALPGGGKITTRWGALPTTLSFSWPSQLHSLPANSKPAAPARWGEAVAEVAAEEDMDICWSERVACRTWTSSVGEATSSLKGSLTGMRGGEEDGVVEVESRRLRYHDEELRRERAAAAAMVDKCELALVAIRRGSSSSEQQAVSESDDTESRCSNVDAAMAAGLA